MADKKRATGKRTPRRRRRGRLFVAFERAVLGVGMNAVAFVIERRLIKAIKKGGVTSAPRTAADPGEELEGEASAGPQGELTTAPHPSG